MVNPGKTNLYKIHLLCRGQDKAPVIRAYRLCQNKNKQYELETKEFKNFTDHYLYTKEDCDWVVEKMGLSKHNQEGSTFKISEILQSNSWFYSSELEKLPNLPDNAITWIGKLKPYLMTDYSNDRTGAN